MPYRTENGTAHWPEHSHGRKGTSMEADLPRYDISKDYAWNYDHAPDPVPIRLPEFPGTWEFLGREVNSPIGIPAGPLLNGRWILYYARLGFDILTYKTVRSGAHPCYPLPNLVPVQTGPLRGTEDVLDVATRMTGSWAVSFGMPSAEPDEWRRDVERTKLELAAGQLLVVSVVGTAQPGWSIDELAEDYARCAKWAVESGADAVEANLSCPNVESRDGRLYREAEAAGTVAATIRREIGSTPLILKTGHLAESSAIEALLRHVATSADALSMTNSVATRVRGTDGALLFDGAKRGICGAATREASLEQTRIFQRHIDELALEIKLIGVGGVFTAEHVQDYLKVGAESVQIATAAMVDPLVAWRIRESWSAGSTEDGHHWLR